VPADLEALAELVALEDLEVWAGLEELEEVIGGSITQRIVAARLIETGPQQTGLAEPLAGTRLPIGRPVPGTRSGARAVTWPPTPAELAGATVSAEQAV
jgi:hypothetical protein